MPLRIGSVAGGGPAESKSKPFAYVLAFDSYTIRHNANSDSHTDAEPDRDANTYRNTDPHGVADTSVGREPELTNSSLAALSAQALAKTIVYIPNFNR